MRIGPLHDADMAPDLLRLNENITSLSMAIERERLAVSSLLIAASEESLIVLGKAVKTIGQLHTQSSTVAIEELRRPSANMCDVGAQLTSLENIGLAALVLGLLEMSLVGRVSGSRCVHRQFISELITWNASLEKSRACFC